MKILKHYVELSEERILSINIDTKNVTETVSEFKRRKSNRAGRWKEM